MKSKVKNYVNIKNKKTAWDLLKEIPDTPDQRKIDREIAAIERKYQDKIEKKSKGFKQKRYCSSKKENITNFYNMEDFGLFASKIWNALNIYGPLNKDSLIDNTKLKNDDFFIGIGWLARENKISKEMNCYKLGNTNLSYEIGENAGKLWKFLNLKGQSDFSTLIKSVELKNEEMFSAIGWLSRENKIKLSYKDKQLLFSLI